MTSAKQIRDLLESKATSRSEKVRVIEQYPLLSNLSREDLLAVALEQIPASELEDAIRVWANREEKPNRQKKSVVTDLGGLERSMPMTEQQLMDMLPEIGSTAGGKLRSAVRLSDDTVKRPVGRPTPGEPLDVKDLLHQYGLEGKNVDEEAFVQALFDGEKPFSSSSEQNNAVEDEEEDEEIFNK
jgi:hypothetical protein